MRVVAAAWDKDTHLYRRTLTFSDEGGVNQVEFELSLPVSIPKLPMLTLYGDKALSWTIRMENPSFP